MTFALLLIALSIGFGYKFATSVSYLSVLFMMKPYTPPTHFENVTPAIWLGLIIISSVTAGILL